MRSRSSSFALTVACGIALTVGSVTLVGSGRLSAAQTETSFSRDVQPILRDNCASCHQPGGEGYKKSGVDLTSYKGVMKGTKYGTMVVPGDPEASNLVLLIEWRTEDAIRMPHGRGQLPIKLRETISRWVQQGAKNN